ncbi:hypothetical protein [Treponema sp.]|uniref:hypothetical protein n=1 Tax=Treponema sp. TaxID=166 RepID=UPI00388D1E1D
MKKFPYFIITFIFAVLFLSCSDLSNSKGTYLVFSSKSRALEKSAEYLTDITLEGKSSAGTLNNTWKTASEFLSSRIEIEAGSWEFTLTAYLKETEYKASTTAQIIAGLENKVTFKLAAVATKFVYLSTGDEIFSDKYESITEAVSAIEDAENCTDWIIYINGEITGTNHVYIGESCASSITITGLTGSTTDILNGNEEGTVLSISTSVPVIIKNLKITGGTGTVSDGYTSAGGIYIGQAATVTLAENTIITGNTVGIDANGKYGGGVYNAGKLFMYGSALF